MGRRSYRVYGVGHTQAEALNNAIDEDIQENGTHEGYNGSIYSDDGGMQCKCVTQPTKGKISFTLQKHKDKTRKWETRYRSYRLEYGRRMEVILSAPTQAECIEKTKAHMERSGIEHASIEQVKVCISNNAECGELINKSTPGKWVFWGEGRE